MKRALIVEDVRDTRKWLVEIVLQAFPACEIQEAGDVRSGLYAITGHDFDLALVDLGLPDGSGLEVLEKFRAHSPDTTAIVTTAMGEDGHIVSALAAGAQGYLLKETPKDLLVNQLLQLADGIPAISPSIARRIMGHFSRTGPMTCVDDDLTAREKEVLVLIAQGLSNPEVGEELGISRYTVASHIKSIYGKLDINSRAEAALHATRMGLTQME
jgi:DNA-binding NarL/FixJ family response regulator